MSKRNSAGRFTRCYNPVAVRTVYVVRSTEHEIPGRHGVTWENYLEGLVKRAPYDPESMAAIATRGGIKALVERVCGYLHGERKALLIERLESICHAKQRAYQIERVGKPLSKAEKRKLRAEKARNK